MKRDLQRGRGARPLLWVVLPGKKASDGPNGKRQDRSKTGKPVATVERGD